MRRIKDLREFTIDAQDTDIGRVRGVYFDDLTWTIRYIVVATSTILSGKEVLISIAALKERAWSPLHIRVNLDWKQVESAPAIDLRRPISRRGEIEQHKHYGWPYYWSEAGKSPSASGAPADPGNIDADTHLRASEECAGYKVAAIDGEIGSVDDFLFDDKSWKIRWAIVNTDGWWSGKLVLISPRWIGDVDWQARLFRVNLSREQIKKSPEWDADKPLSRKYELELHKHYQLPPYWVSLEDGPGVGPARKRTA